MCLGDWFALPAAATNPAAHSFIEFSPMGSPMVLTVSGQCIGSVVRVKGGKLGEQSRPWSGYVLTRSPPSFLIERGVCSIYYRGIDLLYNCSAPVFASGQQRRRSLRRV